MAGYVADIRFIPIKLDLATIHFRFLECTAFVGTHLLKSQLGFRGTGQAESTIRQAVCRLWNVGYIGRAIFRRAQS